jgi:DNA-directed RNA polymerase subunit alpha
MLETNVALPSKPRVVSEEEHRGVFEIDGLYPGYGHTLGNSLRRIILSSLPGASITQVKIEGVEHEFSTIEGVKEDVITILLNLKRVRIKMHGEEPLKMMLKARGHGIVTAADIDAPSQIEILNPEQPIAEITAKNGILDMEITIEHGLGYVPREVHQKEKVEIGTIALDAVFTPIRRVNYEVENMRVGDRTDYNRLRIALETDGTLTPREALIQSIEIMIHQLKAVVGFQEEVVESQPTEESENGTDASVAKTEIDPDILKTRIETLDLSTRTQSALEDALDGIGEKGLTEIEAVLKEMNMGLKD